MLSDLEVDLAILIAQGIDTDNKFYVPLNAKQVILEMLFSISWLGTEETKSNTEKTNRKKHMV